jgi:hypothetical protein
VIRVTLSRDSGRYVAALKKASLRIPGSRRQVTAVTEFHAIRRDNLRN